MIFSCGRVVTYERLIESGWVRIEGDRIVEVGVGDHPGEIDFDLAGRTLIPGFVDQHCHGGGGYSFVTTDPTEALKAARAHLSHGTTSVMASLVSGSQANLVEQVETLVPLVDQGVIAGIHLEGPWISKPYCGAHDRDTLRDPTPAEVGELLEVGAGRIAMVTLTPELPGTMDAIHRVVRADAIAAIGHTDANFDQAVAAVDAGATVGTHLFNAMRPMHHRDPGVVAGLLEDPRVVVELIADGQHVHPAILRMAYVDAGPDRIALVTDAMPAAAAADGRYRLGRLSVDVVDGVARITGTNTIAGSTLTMDRVLRNMVLHSSIGLVEAARMLATTPARAMRWNDRGEIAVGKRADLVVLDARLRVEKVMLGGQWVTPYQ